jgi:hypothetical protein
MPLWTTTVRVNPTAVKILLTDPMGHEVVRARLPRHPDHPRALLMLLEGLALWSGQPLCAAISVAASARRGCDWELLGGTLWPAESALVRVDFVEPVRRRRLRGLGSFRDVYQVHTLGRR